MMGSGGPQGGNGMMAGIGSMIQQMMGGGGGAEETSGPPPIFESSPLMEQALRQRGTVAPDRPDMLDSDAPLLVRLWRITMGLRNLIVRLGVAVLALGAGATPSPTLKHSLPAAGPATFFFNALIVVLIGLIYVLPAVRRGDTNALKFRKTTIIIGTAMIWETYAIVIFWALGLTHWALPFVPPMLSFIVGIGIAVPLVRSARAKTIAPIRAYEQATDDAIRAAARRRIAAEERAAEEG